MCGGQSKQGTKKQVACENTSGSINWDITHIECAFLTEENNV